MTENEDRAAVADDLETTSSEAENEQQTEAEGKPKPEAEANASEDENEDANEDDATDDDDEDDKPKRKSRNRRYAERITAQAAENAQLKRELEEARKAAPVAESPKPKLEDFDSVSDHEEALVAWAVENALSKYSKQSESERQKEAALQTEQKQAQAFQSKMDEARKIIPDFDEVMDGAPDIPVADHVRGLVLESERAAEVVYHFAANPEVLADINQMTPLQAAREIGRLEARLAKPKPRTSKAPPPVKPVRGGATSQKAPEEMSYAEYKKFRER